MSERAPATVTDIAEFKARAARVPKPPRPCECPECKRTGEVFYPLQETQEPQP